MGLLPSSLVRLPDGSTLTVRAIHPGDSDLLLDHFAHLGADARYRRFLAPVHDLTAQEVDYFTHPDHRRHEALFALDDDGRPVGVARYISSAEHPRTAELAVAVVDGWAYKCPYPTSAQRRAALPAFLTRYNTQRPHRSLNPQTPLQRLAERNKTAAAYRWDSPTTAGRPVDDQRRIGASSSTAQAARDLCR